MRRKEGTSSLSWFYRNCKAGRAVKENTNFASTFFKEEEEEEEEARMRKARRKGWDSRESRIKRRESLVSFTRILAARQLEEPHAFFLFLKRSTHISLSREQR
jgi:hypothetical protein